MSEDIAPLRACPECGLVGKKVDLVTLRSLIKSEEQSRITEGQYRFCGTQGCDVVYFAEDGSHVFLRADLSVRVGVKEAEAPRPICYCFHHSIEEITDEIRRTGTTHIPEEIRSRIETEGCHCEETNPQGSCCLGAVLRVAESKGEA
ncbi:MAG: putative iron-sulfur cluster-binding metallochaperone [Symbiobacteriia bacterium]